jgi:hypothetical protein
MVIEAAAFGILAGGTVIFVLCRAIVAESRTKIKETAKHNAKEALALRFAPAVRIARAGEAIGPKPVIKLVKGPKEAAVTDTKGFAPACVGEPVTYPAFIKNLYEAALQAEGIDGARVVVVMPKDYNHTEAWKRPPKIIKK